MSKKRVPKIVLRGSSSSWFYFVVVATNGKTVAQSETYKTKQAAQATISMLVSTLANATVVDSTEPAVDPRIAALREEVETLRAWKLKMTAKGSRKG